jgi:hypothetical protein
MRPPRRLQTPGSRRDPSPGAVRIPQGQSGSPMEHRDAPGSLTVRAGPQPGPSPGAIGTPWRRFPLPASLSRERLLLANSPPPSCPPLALPLPRRRSSPRAPPGPRAPFRRRRVLAPEQPAGRHPRRFLDGTPGCVQTRGGSTADGPASPPGPVPARRPSAPVPKGDSRKRRPRKAARRRPPRKPARPCQWASTPRQRIFRAPLPLPPHVRLSLPPPMGPASARISPNGSPAGRSARRTASVANGPSGREAFPEAKRRLGARHAAGPGRGSPQGGSDGCPPASFARHLPFPRAIHATEPSKRRAGSPMTRANPRTLSRGGYSQKAPPRPQPPGRGMERGDPAASTDSPKAKWKGILRGRELISKFSRR